MKTPTLIISRCFSAVTHESAEVGDFADTGHVYESVEFTFRDLVRELRDFSSLSCSHPGPFPDASVWACSGYEVSDYSTGEEREETLHFSRDNPPRSQKYWGKALRAAGLIK